MARGSLLLDIIFIVAILLSLTLIGIFAHHFNTEFAAVIGEINGSFYNQTNISLDTQPIQRSNAAIKLGTDTALPIIFISLAIVILLLLSKVRSNPAYLVVLIPLMIVILILTAIMANIYTDITAAVPINDTAATWTTANIMWSNMPTLIFVVILVAGIVLYAKPTGTAAGGIR